MLAKICQFIRDVHLKKSRTTVFICVRDSNERRHIHDYLDNLTQWQRRSKGGYEDIKYNVFRLLIEPECDHFRGWGIDAVLSTYVLDSEIMQCLKPMIQVRKNAVLITLIWKQYVKRFRYNYFC